MLPSEREWSEIWFSTREMLRRSEDQLRRSYELLAIEGPRVWHPELPQEIAIDYEAVGARPDEPPADEAQKH